MRRLVLAPRVAVELKAIARYTAERFGGLQASKYLKEIEDAFAMIIDNNEIGRVRDDVDPQFRSLTVGRHVIFFRLTTVIEIVGAPDQRRDIGLYFDFRT